MAKADTAKAGSGDPLLERLEGLVRRAGDEITSQRERIRELEERIETLEKERADERGDLEAWAGKREEIESRLESLVGGLEALLEP